MVGKENQRKIRKLSLRKIVVIGPESTGKSTLSAQLAEALGTDWVPEYARGYLESLERAYEEADLSVIARGQMSSEDQMAGKAGKLLICDTDLNVIKVWSEHSYGHCAGWILEEIARRRYDLYLLTFTDTPWQADPLREHPEDNMRSYFYHQYQDIVGNSGVPWIVVKGSEQERLATALDAIDNLIKTI